MAVLVVALLVSAGRYRARLHVSFLDELPSLVGRALAAAALVACVTALRHETTDVTVFLRAATASVLLLLLGRVITNQCVLMARRRGIVSHRTVVVGAGEVGRELVRLLQEHKQYGLTVAAHLDSSFHSATPTLSRTLEPPESTVRLASVIRATGADVILVADPDARDTHLVPALSDDDAARCDLLVVPRLSDFHTQADLTDHIGAIPIMRIRRPALTGIGWALKRAIDIVVSAIALLLLSPVLLVCAIAVRMDGPGVIFRQERVTAAGRHFSVLKFRSYRPSSAQDSSTTWSIANNNRLGRLGKVLRRTSLDELPQLWNILRGDMTLVGPRPERPHFVAMFSEEHPHYHLRHRVRSGLTGLAQVSGLRGDTSISDRARHDNFYIENWSLWLDAKIIMRTVREVLRAGGR